jgi:hypothetical protein
MVAMTVWSSIESNSAAIAKSQFPGLTLTSGPHLNERISRTSPGSWHSAAVQH